MRVSNPLPWKAIGLSLALVIGLGVGWAALGRAGLPAASSAAPRTGYDPLSPDEQRRAQELALADAGVAAHLANSAHYEVLRVERHEESKERYAAGAWARRADVFFYNYSADTLIQAVANLQTGAIDEVEATRSEQPPLAPAEISRAWALALADGYAGSTLRQAYKSLTGAEFQPDVVRVRAVPLLPADLPDGESPVAICRTHRCAYVVPRTAQGGPIPAAVTVDLSAEAVLDVIRGR